MLPISPFILCLVAYEKVSFVARCFDVYPVGLVGGWPRRDNKAKSLILLASHIL